MIKYNTRLCFALTLVVLLSSATVAQQRGDSGDRVRGETLFTTTYKCYACHGYDAQTGARRLVPMNYTEPGFIAFVQNSPLPQMPPYADVPNQDLADIYSYILSLPVDAPDLADIPLLNEILKNKLDSLDN